jgi:LPS-assembly protein
VHATPSLQTSYSLEQDHTQVAASESSKDRKSHLPGFLIADTLEGQTDETMLAKGHAELRKNNSLLQADELVYMPLSDEIEARGNVVFKQTDALFSGPYMRRNLTEQTGYFDQPRYFIQRKIKRKKYQQNLAPGVIGQQYGIPEIRTSVGSGEAARIDFLGENQLSLKNASFSSCKPLARDWYLQASEIKLDYDEDSGESTHSTIFFKDVPIIYWPTISFPVNNARRSGVLPPTFMASTRDGMDVTTPYYLNLAPNYDLLLNPRYIAQRGTQIGGEFRYENFNYRGSAMYEFLDDRKYGGGRQAYNLTHQQYLGQDITARVRWNGVSDGDYFNDLSTRLVQTSQVILPREVMFLHTPSPWITTTTRFLSYQVLKSDVSKPYALEPQITLNGRQPDFYGADLKLLGQFSQFTHPTNIQGQRLVAYPQLTLPYESPAFFLRPKLGLHATQYNLDTQGTGQTNETRALPTFTLDTGTVFERDLTLGGKASIQTLEPRLYYVNIPYQNQSRLPIFDTAAADFNFAQIFSENRYLGHDRINDANQLTAAVSSRLIDAETGVEHMKAMVGQRYYFNKQQVTLNSIYPNSPTEAARQDNFSSIIAAFSGLVAYRTYLDSAWEYSYKEENTMRYAAGLRYQPGFGKVLTAGYRFNRDQSTLTNQIEQYDIAGQWPLSGQWYLVGRYNYSLQDNRILERIAGFEYNAGCWMGRVVSQRIETTVGQPNTILFLQLELNDFAQLGANPLQSLRRSIPGYGKINDLDTGSLIQ